MAPPTELIIELRHVSCQRGDIRLRDVTLGFTPGSVTMLAGEADSGHELLLRLLGLLEVPDEGEVRIAGAVVHTLDEEGRTKVRDHRIGYVFAAPFLLPAFTPIENVAMPLFKLSDVETGEAQRRGERLLEFAGLPDLIQDPCGELSLPDQHRIAFARALVNEPSLLLIENLDGALDGEEIASFAALARQAAARFSVGVVATVSPAFIPDPADRFIEIAHGSVWRDTALLPRSEP